MPPKKKRGESGEKRKREKREKSSITQQKRPRKSGTDAYVPLGERLLTVCFLSTLLSLFFPLQRIITPGEKPTQTPVWYFGSGILFIIYLGVIMFFIFKKPVTEFYFIKLRRVIYFFSVFVLSSPPYLLSAMIFFEDFFVEGNISSLR